MRQDDQNKSTNSKKVIGMAGGQKQIKFYVNEFIKSNQVEWYGRSALAERLAPRANGLVTARSPNPLDALKNAYANF